MSSTIQAIFNAPQPPAAIEGAGGASKVRRPEVEERPQKPAVDAYIPEEKREPSGRYWLERGEDGQPRVRFDDPERAAAASDRSAHGKQAESCTASTDNADREIEKLKTKQEKLERQIQSETDGAKIKELEQELSRVERELSRKDNDAYRRQHAVFS